jgi:hypothetical protein
VRAMQENFSQTRLSILTITIHRTRIGRRGGIVLRRELDRFFMAQNPNCFSDLLNLERFL